MFQSLMSRASTPSRVMITVASLLFLITFIAPLWEISLSAPQYPEGLSMQIWASKFTGDVSTINILNHYIGMAPITADKFPEFQIFPKVFGAFLVLGLLVAGIGRKALSALYALLVVCFSFMALYDFYQWEYNFGHNLNPDAAIKMDDMVYQPPLIGEKVFLNISASSWPDIGGIAFVLAIVLILIAVVWDFGGFSRFKNLKNFRKRRESHVASI